MKHLKANTLSSVLWLTGLLLLCSCNSAKDEKLARPNILFIAIDDLRPDLSCYGQTQVISPNIDKLAAKGLIFKNAYCNVPVCGASRASLLTGILPTKTRFVGYKARADEDVPNALMLPQVFKEAGYTTLAHGKIFHNMDDGAEQCWSEKPKGSGKSHATSFDPVTTEIMTKRGNARIYESADVAEELYPDAIVAQNTIKDLQRLKKEGKPFFLACGFIRPHLPFYAPKKYWDLYNRDSIVIADNRYRPQNAPTALRGSSEFKTYEFGEYKPKTDDWHRMMKHGYYACTSFTDKLTGDVLNELEKLGLAENTIVVIWGDHGWHLGEHEFWGKHNTMHNALQAPLIIKIPGNSSGQYTDALVEFVDIFPTLCKMSNVEIPATVMGKSFDRLFEKPEQEFKSAVYSRFKSADAIVTKNFTYSLFENGEEMLYDREIDPEENINVASNSRYSETLEKMRFLLKEKEELAASYKF